MSLNPRLITVFESVSTAKRLEKIAEYYHDDAEIVEKVAQARCALDAEIFELAKQAAAPSLLADAARWAALGGAGALGLGIPGYAVGHALLGKAGREARETADQVRNDVLLAGLGLAGTGAGLYGLHRLTGGAPIGGREAPIENKQASDNTSELEELTEKLATVGVIDAWLDQLPVEKLSAETQKLAAEIRLLNRGYGVQLLHEATHE